MTMTLRFRTLPTHALPNVVDAITLSSGYQFAAAVRLIDHAIIAGKRFAIRRHDGSMVVIDTTQMQTIALREMA